MESIVEDSGQAGDSAERTRLRRRAVLRLGFYGTILALALIRFSLNPPVELPIVLILITWYATAGLYFALRPRDGVSGCVTAVLRFMFFAYETTATVVVMHHLGGSGWLAILLLAYPVTELNIISPGRAGVAASVLAIFVCTAMAAAEALGWLSHDPFYSVSEPLYRQAEYVLGVLIVASFTLLAPAIAQLGARS